MRIDKIHIQNFRGIEDLRMDLHPNFSLLIGENGSGKTAILEALSVAMGGFFLGLPGVPSRNIRDEDIRYFKSPEGTYEWALNTKVSIDKGIVNNLKGIFPNKESNDIISWYKERNGIEGKTLHGKNLSLIHI